MDLSPLDIEIGHLSVPDDHRVHVPRLRDALVEALRRGPARAEAPARERPNDPATLARAVAAAIRERAGTDARERAGMGARGRRLP